MLRATFVNGIKTNTNSIKKPALNKSKERTLNLKSMRFDPSSTLTSWFWNLNIFRKCYNTEFSNTRAVGMGQQVFSTIPFRTEELIGAHLIIKIKLQLNCFKRQSAKNTCYFLHLQHFFPLTTFVTLISVVSKALE